MLRADNVICGTSTTGTGTLTLAATPVAPGGIDFDVLARATGNGFANGAAVLVSYTIIEYSSAAFSTAVNTEKGIGTLTLGGSAGIANCTLARTTPQVTATSLNSQPATYNTNAPTAVSIGTAANTLVFIGASASDIPAYLPYFETGIGDNLGPMPAGIAISAPSPGSNLVSVKDYYTPFQWQIPILAKKASVRVTTAYATGSPVSNAYARIYAINSSGRPGKLLIDFGLLGSSNTSLNATGNISSAVHASGYYLTPGEYFFGFICSLSGGSTLPKVSSYNPAATFASLLCSGRFGASNFTPISATTATSGTAGAAPDPANVTGYALNANDTPLFALKDA